jgi:hypothetical protein
MIAVPILVRNFCIRFEAKYILGYVAMLAGRHVPMFLRNWLWYQGRRVSQGSKTQNEPLVENLVDIGLCRSPSRTNRSVPWETEIWILLLTCGIFHLVYLLATGRTTEEVGVRVPVLSRILSSPRRPDRFWGPPNLLSNGYRGHFPRNKAAGAWSWPLTSS